MQDKMAKVSKYRYFLMTFLKYEVKILPQTVSFVIILSLFHNLGALNRLEMLKHDYQTFEQTSNKSISL